MSRLFNALVAGVAVSIISGCAAPRLAQTPYGMEEDEWEKTIKTSYPSWRPPQTVPATEDGYEFGETKLYTPDAETLVVAEEDVTVLPTPILSEPEKTDFAPAADSQSYTVQKGDCLWKIAEKFYGDGKKWTIIADANPAVIGDPHKLKTGLTITIPPAK